MGKQTLGYASRTEAVLALRAQRLDTREIARRIGIPTSTVTALECSAARRRRARPVEQFLRTVTISTDLLDALGPHAARRCMTVNALVRQIVATVVDEKMIDAVLDDADEIQELYQ